MSTPAPAAILGMLLCALAVGLPSYAPYQPGTLLLVEREGKFGFFSPTGTPVIAPVFDQARPFSEGLAAVRAGNRWGYIDRSGKTVIDFRFVTAGLFQEGLAVAAEDAKAVMFIDRVGKPQFEKQFDAALPFSNGVAAVSTNGQWGYIDRGGNWILPATLDAALECSETALCVTRDDGAFKTWSLSTGQATQTIDHGRLFLSMTKYENDLAAVHARSGLGAWYYIDTKGQRKWDQTFAAASHFQEGLAAVKMSSENHAWSYINTEGRKAISGPYLTAGPFRDGYALVTDSVFGMRYYINQKGERVLAMADRPSPSTPLVEVHLRSVPPGAAVYVIPKWDWENAFKAYAGIEAVGTPPQRIEGLSHYLSPTGTTDVTEHVVEKVYTVAFHLNGKWRVVRLDVVRNKPNIASVKFQ